MVVVTRAMHMGYDQCRWFRPGLQVVDILLAALVAGQPALSGAGAKAAAAQYSDAARG